MLKQLNEAKDLNVYKQLLKAFGDFTGQYVTGVGKVYRDMLEAGLKCVPKDKRAQDILALVLAEGSSKAVQDVLNVRLAELPITVRPIYKSGNSKLTAFWKKGDRILDKVYDLLDLKGEGAKGEWTDEKGEKVELLALEGEE